MFVEGFFGGEMEKEFVRRCGLVVLDIDLLAFLTSVQNAKEELGVDADNAAAFLFIFVKPIGGDVDFKDGDLRGVHALGVKPRGFKHEIDVFAKEFHVLEHGTESLGFVLVGDDDVHIYFFNIFMRHQFVNIFYCKILNNFWMKKNGKFLSMSSSSFIEPNHTAVKKGT